MAAEIWTEEKLSETIVSGVDELAQILIPMRGPTGKSSVYEPSNDIPRFISSAAQIADKLVFTDVGKEIGARILKDAIRCVRSTAGTGAEDTVALTYHLVKEGRRIIQAGISPMKMRTGMKAALEAAVSVVKGDAVPFDGDEDATHLIALQAGQDNAVAEMVTMAFHIVGGSGIVTVTDSPLAQATLEIQEGICLEQGYLSPRFITDPVKRVCELSRPLILPANVKLGWTKDLLALLEEARARGRSLLIIAREIDEEVKTLLAVNFVRGISQATAIEAPGFGENRRRQLEAIAAVTGATLLDEDNGGIPGIAQCGEAEAACLDHYHTRIRVAGKNNCRAVKTMRRRVQAMMDSESNADERDKLQDAMKILNEGSVQLKAGGTTEVEMFSQKSRMEDAVCAVYAAIEGGILRCPAASVASAAAAAGRIAQQLNGEERNGAVLVQSALENLARDKRESAAGQGLPEPVKALCQAMAAAESTADTLLTVERAVIVKRNH